MKKIYVKPQMSIEGFSLNSAVAAGCSRIETGTTFEEIEVNCLAEGSHKIFNNSNCDINIDSEGGNDWCVYTYNGYQYLIWPKNGGGFKGISDDVDEDGPFASNSGGMGTLINIQSSAFKAGYLSDNGNTDYHIAPLNANAVSAFGFSY